MAVCRASGGGIGHWGGHRSGLTPERRRTRRRQTRRQAGGDAAHHSRRALQLRSGILLEFGEVTDDARVDLTFPEQDINDLLKSMVLEDFNGGRIAAVSYDSREPISRTLSSFAVNLTGNPTFANIVGQMRGERVDVVLNPGAANQPGKLSGRDRGRGEGQGRGRQWPGDGGCRSPQHVVRGRAAQREVARRAAVEVCQSGDRSEFRRALDVLSLSHDSQKKAVSLHFAGDGKRKVQVGYVIEAPIWKTSYRLVSGGKGEALFAGLGLGGESDR